MICYGMRFSPFVERVWLAAQLKGLDIEFKLPENGLKCPEYLALNPAGKIPTLVDNGFVLPESQVICEYLESKHPENPVFPAGPQERAHASLIARLVDTTFFSAVFPLFPHLDPAVRDDAFVKTQAEVVKSGIGCIEHFLTGSSRAHGDDWTIADCALLPATHFMTFMGAVLGVDFLADAPKLKALMASWAGTDLYKASKAGWEEGFKQFKAMKAAQAAEAAKAQAAE